MAVTADKYELPLCIENSVEKLSKKVGVTANAVSSSITKQCSGRLKGLKYIKITLDEV